jgi:AraC-like DNA-binding protein
MQLFYREYPVTEALRPYVHGFWTMSTDGRADELSPVQRCFPAGTIEWIIQARGARMIGLEAGGGVFTYPGAIFTGICDRSNAWQAYGQSELAGVRLTPEGAIKLFGPPFREYYNGFLDAEAFLGRRIRQVQSDVMSAEEAIERVRILERYLLAEVRKTQLERNYFTEALRLIRQENEVDIASLSRQVYVGERQLQRSFRQQLGISPKGYYRVMRLYKAHQLSLMRKDNFSGIAYQFGFSDPAHFTRDFKQYFGVSPEHHFSSINMKWVA